MDPDALGDVMSNALLFRWLAFYGFEQDEQEKYMRALKHGAHG